MTEPKVHANTARYLARQYSELSAAEKVIFAQELKEIEARNNRIEQCQSPVPAKDDPIFPES